MAGFTGFTWTIMSCCLAALCLEVTVRHTQLMPCEEDEQVCVSTPADCGPPASSSLQKTLNMSCYYQHTLDRMSMTCGWTQKSDADWDVSLIFTSRNKVLSCWGIFNPAATLNVTARIRNHMTGTDMWSQPHSVILYQKFKPPQPVVTVLGSTEDSMVLSLRSSIAGSCWLRYRPESSAAWTQVGDPVPVRAGERGNCSVGELQPSSLYRAAAACRGTHGVMSDWSAQVSGRTLDRAPPRPSDVWFRLEETGSAGPPRLHLMWKTLEPDSHILGYEVSISPDGKMENVTDKMVLLVVEEGNLTVTIRAFNSAGFSPAAQLTIDTRRQTAVPSLRHLWISSLYPGSETLLVQWMLPASPSPVPLSHVAVGWWPEKNLSSSRWSRVSGQTTSTIIEDLPPDESYTVSVFPVYSQQTGSPQSLSASLQQGALMEADGLKVVSVTKATVTITWTWRRKSGPIRVDRYSVILRGDLDTRTLLLWPDQWQHTFHSLTPNTEYSLLLLADNVSRNVLSVTTDFDEVPTVATVTPLLLLAITIATVSFLATTVYKSYCFPPISSPKGSSAGRWLMDPDRQDCAQPRILDLQDFRVLRDQSVLIVDQLSSEELQEDASPPSLSSFLLDTVCVRDAPPITPRSARRDPETGGDAEAVPLLRGRGAGGYFPQQDVRPSPRQSEVCEDTASSERAVCHTSFLRRLELAASSAHTCSYLLCEQVYLSNSRLTAATTEEEMA